MSLRTRVLGIFILGLLLGFGLFFYWGRDSLRTGYRKTVEEMMVDVSQLLAGLVEAEVAKNGGKLSALSLSEAFRNYESRQFAGKIYDLEKTEHGIAAYVTDEKGIVLYSSANPSEVGKDYSRWNDVYLTLRGGYGARRTRRSPSDETSVFYVGAPIRSQGKIVGSLSLIKNRELVGRIVSDTILKLAVLGISIACLTALLGGLLFHWVTRPLAQLRRYALRVAAGGRAPLPRLSGSEVRQLGQAFEEMRVTLEGKNSIERFTQALTHEIKSPLSAIRGAAELSLEPMEPERREKFLRNILQESNRAEELLSLLLETAALEAKAGLDRKERVSLHRILQEVRASLEGLFERRGVQVELSGSGALEALGDPLLLSRCLANLLKNAVEFSPSGKTVRVEASSELDSTVIRVRDEGPGVPEFARERIFEKFFSLERPDTRKNGSGLGLAFAREVAILHGGSLELEPSGSGACFALRLPT